MFKHTTMAKINGWGTVMRFILPIMVTIMLWILGDMRNQMKDMRDTATSLSKEIVTYNTNHLEHHRAIETQLCERLARIETKLDVRTP
jgi:hypothetical protein